MLKNKENPIGKITDNCKVEFFAKKGIGNAVAMTTITIQYGRYFGL
jgi:hypothetical protein